MKWAKSFWSVPKGVLFVALVFGVATLYVSQEVGVTLAQTPPPDGGNMMPPPPSQPMQQSPQNMPQPPMGGTGGSFQPMNPPSGGQPGQFGSQPNMGGQQFGQPGQQGGQQGQNGQNMGGYQGIGPQPGSPQGYQGIGPQPGQPGGQNGQWGQQGPQGQNGQNMGGQPPMKQLPMNGDQWKKGSDDQGQWKPMNPPNMGQGQQGQGQQGGQQGQGQWGPQGQGQNGQNMGPQQMGNGEDMQKQSDQMDNQRKEQMKKEFSRQKKQMAQAGQYFKRLASLVQKLEAKGITVSPDIKTNLDAAQGALDTIMKGESFEDESVQTAMQTMQESNDVLREAGMQLEQLSQMPQVLKQAGSQIKQLKSALARAKKIAQKSKIDLSAQGAAAEAAVTEIDNAFQSVQQLVNSGDAQAAMETLQSDVFEKMGDAFQQIGIIEALQNVGRQVGSFDKYIKKVSSVIAKKVKAGEDMSEAQANLGEMTDKVAELKQMISQKISDPEDLRDVMESIMEAQNNIDQALGLQNFGPQIQYSKDVKQFSGFDFGFGQGPMNGPGGPGPGDQGPMGGQQGPMNGPAF